MPSSLQTDEEDKTAAINVGWSHRRHCKYCKTCHACQVSKTRRPKYGHLPVSQTPLRPWHTILDEIESHAAIITADGVNVPLNAMTVAQKQLDGWK
jgi:hypothetical protein